MSFIHLRNGSVVDDTQKVGRADGGDTLLDAAGTRYSPVDPPGSHQMRAHAALVVNPAGLNNALRYQALAGGADGEEITVEHVDSASNNVPLTVAVTGFAVVVNLATDATSVVTSTADDVLAAVNADPDASQLVIVDLDTVEANDGTGLCAAAAAAALVRPA